MVTVNDSFKAHYAQARPPQMCASRGFEMRLEWWSLVREWSKSGGQIELSNRMVVFCKSSGRVVTLVASI